MDPLPFSKASKIDKDESVAGWKLGGKGKPSDVLLGNIPPDIEKGRGVTMDYAEQICVISLPAIRNLEVLDVAKTALVAIGLAAYHRAFTGGCWLRSRCHLVPEADSSWEVVGTDTKFSVDADKLLEEAFEAIKKSDVPWYGTKALSPSEDLTKLVKEGKEALGTGKDKE
jgi:hypothetical protein